jgi:hypothetical protein
MAFSQNQVHNIEGEQVDAALVALRQGVKLQNLRLGSASPDVDVTGASGNESKEQVKSHSRSVLGRVDSFFISQ